MTWSQFTDGLRAVAGTGSTRTLDPDTATALYGLRMIEGSEADNSGVILTTTGRLWLTRITNRENERLLEAYAAVIDRAIRDGRTVIVHHAGRPQ